MSEELSFELVGKDFIQLNSLLKYMGLVNSGGEANMMIKTGEVIVDGEVEFRLRNKIRSGTVVEYGGKKITII